MARPAAPVLLVLLSGVSCICQRMRPPFHYRPELAMATYMVFETVLAVAVIAFTTVNIALWAFRRGSYRPGPRARRAMRIITVAWVILLPVAGAASLSFGADALATGQGGAWELIVMGAVAVACWPVAVLALRKRRAMNRTL